MKSSVKASPESGTSICVMDIRVQIPNGTAMEPVEQGLTDVTDVLNVDISLSE